MSRALYRKSDPLNATFSKSNRIITNGRGFFYKIRGGKMNGPFATRDAAENDLCTFIKVLQIEAELDPRNFQLNS
ncbi:hypothetical protein FLL45_10015 [Aliikangiella marina]|uniref:DUF6316 domain-containing protein n=1 Tax=Aliikangiella marina TaxID=1712262 RepID=A0A545TDJ2_9GAMM|nr:DUF6316 family protein [Aliikangiella marina]TQV75261.1 hypothetical protein FLL45_10015 [Aliikangiella marina]